MRSGFVRSQWIYLAPEARAQHSAHRGNNDEETYMAIDRQKLKKGIVAAIFALLSAVAGQYIAPATMLCNMFSACHDVIDPSK